MHWNVSLMRGGKARRQEENCNQLQCVYWLFFEEPEGEKEAVKQVYYYWQHLNSFNQLTKANPEPSQSSSWSFLCISHKTFSLNWVCVDRQNVLFKMFNVIFYISNDFDWCHTCACEPRNARTATAAVQAVYQLVTRQQLILAPSVIRPNLSHQDQQIHQDVCGG